MSIALPPQPADSRAHLEWEESGFTLVLPPLGFRAQGSTWFWCLLYSAGLTIVSVIGGMRVFDCPNVFERLACAVLLLPIMLLLRSILFVRIKELLDVSLGRATLVVSEHALYVYWRGLFRSRERVWDRGELEALDEDAGDICLLMAAGESETLLSNRSVAELRWVAGLLRQTLKVPCEPAKAEGLRVRCTPYRKGYSWRGVLCAKPGFLEIRSPLRPGGDLHFVTGKHSSRKHFRDPLTSILTPEDITWLPGEGNSPTLQIRFDLQWRCCLRIDSDDPDAVRAALARFWEPAPVAADIRAARALSPEAQPYRS